MKNKFPNRPKIFKPSKIDILDNRKFPESEECFKPKETIEEKENGTKEEVNIIEEVQKKPNEEEKEAKDEEAKDEESKDEALKDEESKDEESKDEESKDEESEDSELIKANEFHNLSNNIIIEMRKNNETIIKVMNRKNISNIIVKKSNKNNNIFEKSKEDNIKINENAISKLIMKLRFTSRYNVGDDQNLKNSMPPTIISN